MSDDVEVYVRHNELVNSLMHHNGPVNINGRYTYRYVSWCVRRIVCHIRYVSRSLLRCPSVRLSVRPAVCPSVHLSVRPSVRPSSCLSVRPSVRPSSCPSVRPAVRPSVQLSVRPSSCPSVRPAVRPSVHLSVQLSVRPSLRHTLRIPICVQRPAKAMTFWHIIIHVLQWTHDLAFLLFSLASDPAPNERADEVLEVLER